MAGRTADAIRDFTAAATCRFRGDQTVRSFAQTGPVFSCLVAGQTRLQLVTDGRWMLEAWGDDNPGVPPAVRPVISEHADWWLGVNGYGDEAAVRRRVVGPRTAMRTGAFTSAAECAAGLVDWRPVSLEDVG